MNPFKPIEIFPFMYSEPGNKFIPNLKGQHLHKITLVLIVTIVSFYLLLALIVNAGFKMNSKMHRV